MNSLKKSVSGKSYHARIVEGTIYPVNDHKSVLLVSLNKLNLVVPNDLRYN